MKILYISPYPTYPINSAARIRTACLLNALKQHNVKMLYLNNRGEEADTIELDKRTTSRNECDSSVSSKGGMSLIGKVLSTINRKPIPAVLHKNKQLAKEIQGIVSDYKSDVLWVETLSIAQDLDLVDAVCQLTEYKNISK